MNIAIILATLSLVLCVVSFLYLRGYVNRKISAELFLAEYRAEVEKLNAEIDAATDRDSLLVEARIKKLQNVLADADRRIAVYVRELERRQPSVQNQTGATTQSQFTKKPVAPIQPELVPQPVTPPPEPTPAAPPVQPATPLYTSLGRGGFGSGAGGGDRLGLRIVNVTEPEPTVATVADNAVNAGGEKKELRVQIAELAAQGLSPAEIVSQLEVSRSEVDTVLSLSRLKKNSA